MGRRFFGCRESSGPITHSGEERKGRSKRRNPVIPAEGRGMKHGESKRTTPEQGVYGRGISLSQLGDAGKEIQESTRGGSTKKEACCATENNKKESSWEKRSFWRAPRRPKRNCEIKPGCFRPCILRDCWGKNNRTQLYTFLSSTSRKGSTGSRRRRNPSR